MHNPKSQVKHERRPQFIKARMEILKPIDNLSRNSRPNTKQSEEDETKKKIVNKKRVLSLTLPFIHSAIKYSRFFLLDVSNAARLLTAVQQIIHCFMTFHPLSSSSVLCSSFRFNFPIEACQQMFRKFRPIDGARNGTKRLHTNSIR